MKAVLQYRASLGLRRQLEARSPDWLQVTVVDEPDKDTFAVQMHEAEVLLHVLEPVTPEVIAIAPKLRLIQKIGVGVDTIDLEAARSRGIAVANMPGTNSQAVAEMTLALMFAALRRIPLLDRETRAGRGWTLPLETFDAMGEIAGRVVGLVGYGEVPRRIAPVLHALGATVLYTARAPKASAIGEWRSLPDLLAASDIVSLHVPLTAETAKLINGESIAGMKSGAVLVNTARGGLVDETALIAALRSGQVSAAGLDVLAIEPARSGDSLLNLDNVVVTPHVAWRTPETLARSIEVISENCRRLRDGEALLNRVV